MSDKYKDYKVTWEIDLSARNYAEAAMRALIIQRDAKSFAEYFTVKNVNTGREKKVDLTRIEERKKLYSLRVSKC